MRLWPLLPGLMLLVPSAAWSQNVAQQVITGYVDLSGCSTPPCFHQFGGASGTGSNVNITGVGGNTVTTTLPTNDPGVIAAIQAAAGVIPYTGTPNQTSASCTGSDTIALAAAAANLFLDLEVPKSATAGVWVNYAGTAAVAASPSKYIAPGANFSWNTNYVPTSAIHCIADSGTVPLTLVYK